MVRYAAIAVFVFLVIAPSLGFYDSAWEQNAPVIKKLSDFSPTANGVADDSSAVQRAVNSVSDQGGGKLTISSGTYKFGQIQLRSNVVVELARGVKIVPKTREPKTYSVFELGINGPPITNVAVRGNGGNFVVTMASTPGRLFLSGRVTNFMLKNFKVVDVRSKFSAATFVTAGGPGAGDVAWPTKGTVQNAEIVGADYGYGLVQTHAVSDVRFINLHANGGVALRIETGSTKMNNAQIGGVFNIVARGISAENCNAALMLSPHAMKNGRVRVETVTATNCGFGVRIGAGFVSKKYSNPSLVPGYFGAGSYVKGVDATFGMSAQLKPKHYKYMPRELFGNISQTPIDPGGLSFIGPSIAAVGYFSTTNEIKVDASLVKARGFLYQKKIITPADAF